MVKVDLFRDLNAGFVILKAEPTFLLLLLVIVGLFGSSKQIY